MTKKAAKNFAFWVAADDTTTPVVGDAVAYVRSVAPSLSRPSTDVSTSGDTTQSWVAGIPGGTVSLSGVTDLTNAGDIQLFDYYKAGSSHKFRLVPDADDVGDYWEGIGFIEQLTPLSGSHNGTFTFNATIRLTGDFDWVSAV